MTTDIKEWARDPAEVGHVFTHITFEGQGDHVFDRQLDLELGDVLLLHRAGGDLYFAVNAMRQVVIDAPERRGQPKRSTFVQFINCEAIPEEMRAKDAPLSEPPAKVRIKNKEKP